MLKHHLRSELRREQALLALLFGLAEILWLFLGIRFDTADPATTPLHHYVQYVEPALLRERFWETLYYLHVQPPLYQAYLGIVVQFPERWQTPLFSLTYSAMALTLVLAARALLSDLGLSKRARMAACVFLIFSPPLVLMAKWLYVPMPVAALLVLAALMLHRAIAQRRARYLAGYGCSLAAVALITSYFHLIWLLLMLGLGTLGMRSTLQDAGAPSHEKPAWRDLAMRLACLWTPLLPVLAVYTKNALLFGSFTASTWSNALLFGRFTASTWSNVAPSRTARDSIGPAVLEQLIDEGRVSPWMRHDLQERLRVEQLPQPHTGIPVLDQPRRRSGKVNWNYHALLPIYRDLGKDASYIARHYPGAWFAHARRAFGAYQAPATWSEYAVGRNRARIVAWSRFFEQFIWGAALGTVLERATGVLGWVTLPTLLAPLLLLYAAKAVRSPTRPRAERCTLAFLSLNLLYVAALAVGIADNEYERYHLFSDALLYLLVCRALADRWSFPRFSRR